MINLMKRIWKEEEGATLVEYALLVALIAVAVIAMLAIFLPDVSTALSNTGATIKASSPGAGS